MSTCIYEFGFPNSIVKSNEDRDLILYLFISSVDHSCKHAIAQ